MPCPRLASAVGMVLACVSAHCESLPDLFFLTSRAIRDTRSDLALSLSRAENTVSIGADILDGRVLSLGYAGAVSRHAGEGMPLCTDHGLVLPVALSGGAVELGLRTGVAVSALVDYNENFEWGLRGEHAESPGFYWKRRVDDSRHTRVTCEGAGNVRFDTPVGNATLAISGRLTRHYGYELAVDDNSSYGTAVQISDFEPRDLYGALSLGIVFVRRFRLFNGRLVRMAGLKRSVETDGVGLRHGTSPVEPRSERADPIVITKVGYVNERDTISAWAALRPRNPSSTADADILRVGTFPYGFRLADGMVRYRQLYRGKAVSEYTVHHESVARQTLNEYEIRVVGHELLVRAVPELFLARHLSFVLPASLERTGYSKPSVQTGELREPSTGLAIACGMHVYLPLGPNHALKGSLRSGDFVFSSPASVKGASNQTLYRRTAETLSLELTASL